MRNLVLFGAGRVGHAFLDIWNDKNILVVDSLPWSELAGRIPGYNIISVSNNININEKLKEHIQEFQNIDIAVVAVPGNIGFMKCNDLLEMGINVVDISFHDGDCEDLGKVAKQNNCWYIPDAGFGPGIMNMMVRRTQRLLDNPCETNIYVGGLPILRYGPWEYVSTWNIKDHLSEYIRPARYIVNRALVIAEPLEDAPVVIHSPIGNLEGFRSDGLRSLLKTINISHMSEYTLRWPGFIKKMKLMKDTGLLNAEMLDCFANAIEKSGVWDNDQDMPDLSYLMVASRSKYWTVRKMSLLHRKDSDSRHSSMSWCTAAGAAATLAMSQKEDLVPGVHYIEDLVNDNILLDCYMEELKRNNLVIYNSDDDDWP